MTIKNNNSATLIKSAILLGSVYLSGCATITQGTGQTLTFNLDPKETHCKLTRVGDGEIGSISYENNLLTTTKDKDDIIAQCSAPSYKNKTTTIKSSASGAAVGGAILLDLGITDLATGAFWKYPEAVAVTLEKETVTGADALNKTDMVVKTKID